MPKSTLLGEDRVRDDLLTPVGLGLATLEAVAFAALFRLAADDLRELLPFFAIRDHSCSRRHGLGTCPAITRPDRA
ncbi:MAG TPA: hypothetical protein VMX14_12805, partial [Anaerolineae bacterium]|nr:hypothetical protein [Anaerolineae bacterium]